VLPNVIDLPDFDERSARPLGINLPEDRVIAVAVGNLHACKRFDRFIEALALARRHAPELTGVIAGADCGVKAALQIRAEALGLTPRDLIFLGAFDQVPALLARSAMLVLTSDYEGFPNVILEAMAARLPVISVPAGDAGLIVQPDKTGRVVAAEDVRSMAEFMVQLVQDPALRMRLGEAGRKCVEQGFNCEPLAERLLAVFHRFASRQQRRFLCGLLERGVAANNSAPVAGAQNFASSHPLNSHGLPASKAFTTTRFS
jgi:glycosyltransferase involved in cell wall biosynthesis